MNQYSDIGFLYKGEEHRILSSDKKVWDSYEKSTLYNYALFRFLKAYEILAETAYIRQLKEKGSLAIIVIPRGSPSSSRFPGHFSDYLKSIECDNFVVLESEKIKTGDLQIPGSRRIDRCRIRREKFNSAMRLEKLERVYDLLGINGIDMSGGKISGCLYEAERSISYTGIDDIRILSDVSVSGFNLAVGAIISSKTKWLHERIGDDGYVKMHALLNSLMDMQIDFSGLKEAIKKSPDEQLAVFMNYKPVISLLNDVKQIYSGYNHCNVGQAGFMR
jgi:hypothetical protein